MIKIKVWSAKQLFQTQCCSLRRAALFVTSFFFLQFLFIYLSLFFSFQMSVSTSARLGQNSGRGGGRMRGRASVWSEIPQLSQGIRVWQSWGSDMQRDSYSDHKETLGKKQSTRGGGGKSFEWVNGGGWNANDCGRGSFKKLKCMLLTLGKKEVKDLICNVTYHIGFSPTPSIIYPLCRSKLDARHTCTNIQ